jgi:hypothetical protein
MGVARIGQRGRDGCPGPVMTVWLRGNRVPRAGFDWWPSLHLWAGRLQWAEPC